MASRQVSSLEFSVVIPSRLGMGGMTCEEVKIRTIASTTRRRAMKAMKNRAVV